MFKEAKIPGPKVSNEVDLSLGTSHILEIWPKIKKFQIFVSLQKLLVKIVKIMKGIHSIFCSYL